MFTSEAVSCGAIHPAFQRQLLTARQTAVLETAPGHADRCVASHSRTASTPGAPSSSRRRPTWPLPLGALHEVADHGPLEVQWSPVSNLTPAGLAGALERALRAQADPVRAANEARYLKSTLRHLGVRVPAVRLAARPLARAAASLPPAGLRALVNELWGRGIHECRLAGVELLVAESARLAPDDLPWLERLCREARTWALLDPLAARVLGPLRERHPGVERALRGWTADADFWLRRAALLAHGVALREGRGDLEAFGALAEPLLGEQEFFIRKAIGWVLRDTARRRPAEVAAWLLQRAGKAAPLTVREAVKHLSARDRAAILAAAALSARRRGAGRPTSGAARDERAPATPRARAPRRRRPRATARPARVPAPRRGARARAARHPRRPRAR